MSIWIAKAIERKGVPENTWPTIFGPLGGSDPVAANDLHVLDLTPVLYPIEAISQEMERDFLRSPIGEVAIELMDADGAWAEALGRAEIITSNERDKRTLRSFQAMTRQRDPVRRAGNVLPGGA